MEIDLRPVKKLRESAAARSALGPIIEAVCASAADLSRLRVVCDWIQYRQNFREPVAARPIGDSGVEVAFDQATGRAYEQSLPGGESDATNTEAARELILELFRIWDDLAARRALPDELYVLELGVGNGNQARTWLDEFVSLDRRHGRDYYRRLRYLMGDYSPHVLDRARQAVAHHSERISALVVEATRPAITLGFLAGKAFLVYISNVYDNLPTDEVARIGGRTYLVETQAFLADAAADVIAGRFSITRDRLAPLIDRLLRIGPELLSESAPEHFADLGQAVSFWQAVWESLRLRERYAPRQRPGSNILTLTAQARD